MVDQQNCGCMKIPSCNILFVTKLLLCNKQNEGEKN